MEEHEKGGQEGMEDEEAGTEHGMHDWNKCGCPFCQGMRAMHKMHMMGPMMAGMGMMKGMGMPDMMGMGMGMGMPGMMGMAPWRKFMSSDEKIAGLEKYLEQLQMEAKAVQEKIEHIRNK